MVDQPDHLVLVQLREIRAENAKRFDAIDHRLDAVQIEMAELRAEMRETRTAVTGVGYFVNLSTGDLKAELAAFGERLARLERERA